MRFTDISNTAVRTVLGQMPDTFRTTDVSKHPVMLDAHSAVSGESHYHSVVGRYLSKHRVSLGIQLVSTDGGYANNALWRKSRA